MAKQWKISQVQVQTHPTIISSQKSPMIPQWLSHYYWSNPYCSWLKPMFEPRTVTVRRGVFWTRLSASCVARFLTDLSKSTANVFLCMWYKWYIQDMQYIYIYMVHIMYKVYNIRFRNILTCVNMLQYIYIIIYIYIQSWGYKILLIGWEAENLKKTSKSSCSHSPIPTT